jgi:hypothetical protein
VALRNSTPDTSHLTSSRIPSPGAGSRRNFCGRGILTPSAPRSVPNRLAFANPAPFIGAKRYKTKRRQIKCLVPRAVSAARRNPPQIDRKLLKINKIAGGGGGSRNLSSPFRFCNLLILQTEESAKRPTQACPSYNYRTICLLKSRQLITSESPVIPE